MSTATQLEISHLSAGYDDLTVLNDVSLSLEEGRIGVLMGPNGAGKSTLLKSIFNLTNRTSGTITFQGQDITGLPTHQLIEQGIAFVPQGKTNFSTLTVKENLLMGAIHTSDKEADQNLKQVLATFPALKDRLTTRAFELSGGQQQMVALARALMQQPKLLLLDEPSLGLAPKLVKDTFAHIKKINQRYNITALIVEHNIKSVLDIADFAYIMVSGRIIAAETPAKLKESEVLKKVFVGEFE